MSRAAGEHASLGALLLRLTSPGPAGHLPGRRVLVAQPRRPRQPPAGRLERATYRAREPAPTRETLKFHLIRRVLRLRVEQPEAFFGSYEPLDLGPDRVGFVRGGAIRVVVPLRRRIGPTEATATFSPSTTRS